MSKFEVKTRISKGVNAKKWKVPGIVVVIKLTGNPGGSTPKKLISSTGGTISSGKAHCLLEYMWRTKNFFANFIVKFLKRIYAHLIKILFKNDTRFFYKELKAVKVSKNKKFLRN